VDAHEVVCDALYSIAFASDKDNNDSTQKKLNPFAPPFIKRTVML